METGVVRGEHRPIEETDWGSLQWLLGGDEDLGLTLGRVTFKPGQANPAHLHPNCAEVLYVIKGELEHTLPGGDMTRLKPGDCILLPPDDGHYARNVGDDEAVVLVIYNSEDRQVIGE